MSDELRRRAVTALLVTDVAYHGGGANPVPVVLHHCLAADTMVDEGVPGGSWM